MDGGPSHLDTFDPKPLVNEMAGKPLPKSIKRVITPMGVSENPLLASKRKWKNYGECGMPVSDWYSHVGECADDLCVIRSCTSDALNHVGGVCQMNTGSILAGRPSLGSWVSYGLGTENENLPTFVVLPDHRGLASNGTKNWDAAFLPQQHSGTVIYPGTDTPIADLFPHKKGDFVTRDSEAAAHAVMAKLNQAHAATRAGDDRLDSRIRSYELAARMQLAAPEALDISHEPDYVLRAYGINHSRKEWPKEINAEEEADIFGRKCLVARRLLERGVRFVQIWSGNDNGFPRRNWDSHEDIERDHGPLARGMARGASALIQDLRQRGLLDDTIILWTTEFGRMPSTQGGKGRDHNPFVFTNWLCGGGIRGNTRAGSSAGCSARGCAITLSLH
mgnify:CR=1 FL=1